MYPCLTIWKAVDDAQDCALQSVLNSGLSDSLTVGDLYEESSFHRVTLDTVKWPQGLLLLQSMM